jgi:hypothetical protein
VDGSLLPAPARFLFGEIGYKASAMSDPTRDELYEQAKEMGVPGRSTMNRSELEEAVEEGVAGPRSKEPPPQPPTGSWLRDHLLSVILGSLFLVSLIGQYYYQYQYEVQQAIEHGQPPPGATSAEYLNSFLASMLENWQSEFLQLVSFVVLATYFIHRGSPQSRDGDDELKSDIKAIREKLGA